VISFEKQNARSVPKNPGQSGRYKISSYPERDFDRGVPSAPHISELISRFQRLHGKLKIGTSAAKAAFASFNLCRG